ncbi:hypothetical protein [Methylobacterium organophilum]|uniref:Uncharacterized protein n=1 Tax=Methylobacterium organophilum TaxID=410 RepID=A0ABQ4TDL5_METOR|nr:hypothetical protein [Methylobacterium organophilum]GJE29776.1 hypothetical protein LKMONMHP_4662 [Methylobacterium organophilum]
MALPLAAYGISVNGCGDPRCKCGSLIVRLHDAQGDVAIGIVLPKPLAEEFAAEVVALVPTPQPADADASPLSTIRCEGTA